MSNAERVAAVTGATSGIGREVARKLAEAGASVAVAGRNEAEGAETVRLITAAGGSAWFTPVDVSDTLPVTVGEVRTWTAPIITMNGAENGRALPGSDSHR